VTAGFYSPLPPAHTGVADYSAALLPELRRLGKVAVAPRRCDIALYHVGNNALHADIYRRALQRPGVVVLHDAVLHHFLLGQLGESEYLEEFVYNYGEWSRSLARDLWRARAASGVDSRYFEYPMLRRIAETARAVVVHNPAAAQTVRRHAARARVVEIPHIALSAGLPPLAEILRFRDRVGVPQAAFLFGIFGYLRESKRLMNVLEVFTRVRAELPAAALLVAGQFVSADLERAAAPLLASPGVVRLPYLPERDFSLAAAAVDAGISLRYPAAGETSGITIRLMGLAKPVLVTDGPEYARFPEDACIRVAAGVGERESLRRFMILLTSMNQVARAIGQRGAGHIQAHHRVEQVGKQFWNLLCETCG
jgi:glycosyltransferase involved in cell wall biosynthesis